MSSKGAFPYGKHHTSSKELYTILYMKAHDIIVSISLYRLFIRSVFTPPTTNGTYICSVNLIIALLLAKISKANGRE